MRFWEKFLKNIYKIAAKPYLQKLQAKSFENTLKKSLEILESEMIAEMKQFILCQQTKQGGFADRAGRCDLYYTLFGCYLAETLNLSEVNDSLKPYIQNTVENQNLIGIDLFCAAIIYVKVIGIDDVSDNLAKQIVNELNSKELSQIEYNHFLGIVALYYCEDYGNLNKLIKSIPKEKLAQNVPCPVVAAKNIIYKMSNSKEYFNKELFDFYRNKGGFAALKNLKTEDLLSTAVALYSLVFNDFDVRTIKPECLMYVDSLYESGGFCATITDFQPDVEFTFYGLLALGALGI